MPVSGNLIRLLAAVMRGRYEHYTPSFLINIHGVLIRIGPVYPGFNFKYQNTYK